MANGRFIAYFRVSTDKQGKSGLGLEAQRAAVMSWLNGGSWDLIEEFTEIESGAKNDRAELAKALAACRAHRATLVIAKLDRLARDAAFLLGLQSAGVEFVAVDMPTANRLTVGIMALVAEEERRAISSRTKAALQAAKARGVQLGGDRGYRIASEDRQKGTAAAVLAADTFAADLLPVIRSIQEQGVGSANGIAAELNARGIPTRRGGRWQAVQVLNILARRA